MRSISTFLLALLLAGCATREQSGEFVGVILGAAIGNAIGTNSNTRAVGTLAGAVIGGVIGGRVGRQLDEEDRRKAEAAQDFALSQPANAQVDWHSDRHHGVRGSVQTTEPMPSDQGRCRNVLHSYMMNGIEHRENRRACQRPDGTWVLL